MTSTSIRTIPDGTWEVDPIHSTIGFVIRHNSVSKFHGQFADVVGSLRDGVLTGVAQVASVEVRMPQLKEHLLTPDFFDAATTPTVEFRSSDIRVGPDGEAQVAGELTLRGITKPVTAAGTLMAGMNGFGAEVVGFDIDTTIDRRDYGMTFQAALPNGRDVLGWDVTIEAHLELGKA